MGKSKIDKKMEIRRTRNKLAGNLERLEAGKREYIEKAKTAYKRGDKHAYSLARSGLATTLTQQKRTREMLLNIDITTQMRDTGEITEEFLSGMETIFRALRKINKSVDIKSAQKGLRGAITGMESMQMQLDNMLLESEDTFAELGGLGGVSDAEIDRLLGLNAAVEEETEIGAQIDEMIDSVEKSRQESAPEVLRVGGGAEERAQSAEPKPTEAVRSSVPSAEPAKERFHWQAASRSYALPPLDLLDDYASDAAIREANESALAAEAEEAEKVLAELGVPAKVVSRVAGPAFSRLELVMPTGMSVQKVEPLTGDIAMRLGKSARLEVPIPDKNAFGIEFAGDKRETVGLKEILASDTFAESDKGIRYALAVDIERNPVVKDLTRAPHLLIAGSTGSGKSCFLHSVITSLLYKYTPAELRLAIVDFKRVEMAAYNGLPHLLTDTVVDDDGDALALFENLCAEMERRYEAMQAAMCRNIEEYNAAHPDKKLPYIVVFVDEYADVSTSPQSKEFETVIRKISQKSRASGIHLVLATQRPSTDVISGVIKCNFPVQIAFKVARKEDSRTTLAGQSGAERLSGCGDMLYNESSASGLQRLQAPFVSSDETRRVVRWIMSESRKGA